MLGWLKSKIVNKPEEASEPIVDSPMGGDIHHRQAGVENSPRSKLGLDTSKNNYDVDQEFLKERGNENRVNPSTYHRTAGDSPEISRDDQLNSIEP